MGVSPTFMTKTVAIKLRKNMTDAERFLWQRLRLKQIDGLKFRRQCPIDKYVVDFVCLERRLIVELDGGQHIEEAQKDEVRTKWLQNQGFKVLRFWNHDVFKNIEGILEEIERNLTPTLTLPHKGGGNDLETRKGGGK